MACSWKYDRAKNNIEARLKEVDKVQVVEYTRDTSLNSIQTNKAYRMDAVHIYADIVNLDEMLNSTGVEGETCHKRTLRFLNLHYRAAHRILSRCGAIRVDFHNQRLHAVVAKPYGADNEEDRVDRAVAIAQMLIDVLAETGEEDKHIADAKVRVGIDTGKALVVNNGRRGGREPLFLGKPANFAAKLASSGSVKKGIFLSNEARDAIGLDRVNNEASNPLTKDEIADCQESAALDVTKEKIVDEWRDDNKSNPIGDFEFSRHMPPLSNLDISKLTPANSRRMEAVSVYADIDGFSAFVDEHIDDNAEDVVRCLHVIRSELDRVVTSDFGGRRIRFIGDCVHGLLLEGTAQTTDVEKTISTAVLCAGGLRSSFDLALERLGGKGVDTDSLGLAIGFDHGPMTITRLGMQGDRVRCSVSRGVISSENQQRRCSGTQTAIGEAAYGAGSDAVRKAFGTKRIRAGLNYDAALESMAADQDRTAKAVVKEAYAVTSPALARSIEQNFRPHSKLL